MASVSNVIFLSSQSMFIERHHLEGHQSWLLLAFWWYFLIFLNLNSALPLSDIDLLTKFEYLCATEWYI